MKADWFNVITYVTFAFIALVVFQGLMWYEVEQRVRMRQFVEEQWERSIQIPHAQKGMIGDLQRLGGKVK